MNTRYLQIAAAADARVDNIDVAQLLRDLGEASASSGAVDLFGLCLKAQRVLERVQSTGTGGVPAETALLTSYRAMNDAGRSRLVSLAKRLETPFARQQPALTLVGGGQGRPGRVFAIGGRTHMEGASDGQ